MNEFDVYEISVVGYPIFTCSRCGKKGRGSAAKLEFENLGELINGLSDVGMNHLPVGWACHGRQDTRCQDHTELVKGYKEKTE